MTLVQRAEQAEELWRTMMPRIEAPDRAQFVRWASRFSDSIMNSAIVKTSQKFSKEEDAKVVTTDVHRYATGLMLNFEKRSDEDNEPKFLGRHHPTVSGNKPSNHQQSNVSRATQTKKNGGFKRR